MVASFAPLVSDAAGDELEPNEIDAEAPFGVHLSITDESTTTMTATWYTNGTDDPGTTIHYGPSCENLNRTVQGSSSRLTLDPGTLVHSATMTGLTPGETFAYEVGGASGFSDCYETHTIPEDGPVNFAVYGDQGVDQGAPDVHDVIQTNRSRLDLILIAGDLTYAEGDQGQWDEWVLMNQDLFARVPMMGAPGNHEADTPIGTEDFQEHLTQPGAEVYYSFEAGNVHFVVINSDISQARFEGHFQEMMAFVEQDLQEAYEAKQTGEIDHIMFLQHHPIYSDANHGDDRTLMTLEEHWFHRYGVKFLFTGHDHVYERSYPVVYEQPTSTNDTFYENPTGWIHVVTGGGGDGLYRFQETLSPWLAEHKRVYHYTEVAVEGPTVNVTAIEATPVPGKVIDEFTLVDTGESSPIPPTVEQVRTDDAHAWAR